MTLTELRDKHFYKIKFRRFDLQQAGKILKREGEDAAFLYLRKQQQEAPLKGDFRPPAKCEIVDWSRPVKEWPIAIASANMQEYVYGLSKAERDQVTKFALASQEYADWFARTGVDNAGYTHVQGLNKSFNNAFRTYDGVARKVANRNEKRKLKAERDAERAIRQGREPEVFEPEDAFDERGFLKQKPGINPSIWTYQQVSPVPYDPALHSRAAEKLGPRYQRAEPAAYADRLAIPEGEPGHVPQWQRDAGLLSTNKHKRMRAPYSWHNNKPKPNRRTTRTAEECRALGAPGAILAVIEIGEDWLAVDLRGLLRSAYYRDILSPKEVPTAAELLKLFTGDPTIDPARNEVTFIYKEDVVPILKRKPLREREGRKKLLDLTAPVNGVRDFIAIASIDLGVTNPAAMSYSRLRQDAAGEFEVDELAREFLPPDILDQCTRYHRRWDEMKARFKEQALRTLSEADQAECEAVFYRTGDQYAADLAHALQLDVAALPWAQMSSRTTYITDALLARGGSPATYHNFVHSERKKGKKKKQGGAKPKLKTKEKPSDFDWAYDYIRKQLSKEVRERFSKALWEIERTSPDYARLSKQKRDLGRRVANHIVKQARKLAGTQTLVVVVENINVVFFHGTGKRSVGWNQCFLPKKENRWFVQAIHKALTEIATHKGIYVIEASPYNTSLHCPKCEHIDSGNRCGELFRCLKCGYTAHADLEVATHNIRLVALSGAGLRKPKDEAVEDSPAPSPAASAEKPPRKRRGGASGDVAILEAAPLA